METIMETVTGNTLSIDKVWYYGNNEKGFWYHVDTKMGETYMVQCDKPSKSVKITDGPFHHNYGGKRYNIFVTF